MNDRHLPDANEDSQSRNEPRDNRSLANRETLQPETRRPNGNLHEGAPASSGPPSLRSGDRSPADSQGVGLQDLSRSPLAQMHQLIERAGEAPFDERIQQILSQDAPDEIIDIKPNGAIYVSHPIYRDILDRAFGIGGWALIPLEAPRIKGDRAIWYGFLKCHGRYIESAYGGCTFVPKNREMNEDDAVEGAKSDCLTRCCKVFPLFRNLWNRDFAESWKKEHAQQVENPNYPGRRVWKKKGAAMKGVEGKPGRGHQSPYRKPARVEDENQAHLDAINGRGSGPIVDYPLGPEDNYEDMGRWEAERQPGEEG